MDKVKFINKIIELTENFDLGWLYGNINNFPSTVYMKKSVYEFPPEIKRKLREEHDLIDEVLDTPHLIILQKIVDTGDVTLMITRGENLLVVISEDEVGDSDVLKKLYCTAVTAEEHIFSDALLE